MQERSNLETFFRRGKNCVPLGGTFGDFCDFGAPIGGPRSSILLFLPPLKFGPRILYFLHDFLGVRAGGAKMVLFV